MRIAYRNDGTNKEQEKKNQAKLDNWFIRQLYLWINCKLIQTDFECFVSFSWRFDSKLSSILVIMSYKLSLYNSNYKQSWVDIRSQFPVKSMTNNEIKTWGQLLRSSAPNSYEYDMESKNQRVTLCSSITIQNKRTGHWAFK